MVRGVFDKKDELLALSNKLAAQGIDVTPQYISNIRSEMRKANEIGENGKKPEAEQNRRVAQKPKAQPKPKLPAKQADVVVMDNLLAAKKFVDEVGDVEKAKSAIDCLAKLR